MLRQAVAEVAPDFCGATPAAGVFDFFGLGFRVEGSGVLGFGRSEFRI